MPKIAVIGCSGSGKSTLSASLSEALNIPWLELDALNHQSFWSSMKPDRFQREVSDFIRLNNTGIIDGNYPAVADLVLSSCSDLIWIDLPLRRVLWQLSARSLRRVILRTELWNGNRESLWSHFSRDPHESVIRWAIKTHGDFPARYAQMRSEPLFDHINFIRFTKNMSYEKLVDSLSPSAQSTISE